MCFSQLVVSMGKKQNCQLYMFFQRVSNWLATTTTTSVVQSDEPRMIVEWLPLSTFCLYSEFVLLLFAASSCMNVSLEREHIRVTGIMDHQHGGGYRSVTFSTDAEFEIFLKMEIQRRIRLNRDIASDGTLTPTMNNLGKRKRESI